MLTVAQKSTIFLHIFQPLPAPSFLMCSDEVGAMSMGRPSYGTRVGSFESTETQFIEPTFISIRHIEAGMFFLVSFPQHLTLTLKFVF